MAERGADLHLLTDAQDDAKELRAELAKARQRFGSIHMHYIQNMLVSGLRAMQA